jgi:hypothetical protein
LRSANAAAPIVFSRPLKLETYTSRLLRPYSSSIAAITTP